MTDYRGYMYTHNLSSRKMKAQKTAWVAKNISRIINTIASSSYIVIARVSSFQNHTHPDDHTIRTTDTDTPGFKHLLCKAKNVDNQHLMI